MRCVGAFSSAWCRRNLGRKAWMKGEELMQTNGGPSPSISFLKWKLVHAAHLFFPNLGKKKKVPKQASFMCLYWLILNHMKTNHLNPVRHAKNWESPATEESPSPRCAGVTACPPFWERGEGDPVKVILYTTWAALECRRCYSVNRTWQLLVWQYSHVSSGFFLIVKETKPEAE